MTTSPPAITPTTAPPLPLVGKTVVVDAGHNGKNFAHTAEINRPIDIGTQQRACDTTGAQTNDGYSESQFNLDVVLLVAQQLRAAGATVVMTRETNDGWGPCIDERAAIGNRAVADVGISVHADGGPATGRGFHVIYPPSLPGLTDDIAVESLALAQIVRERFEAGTGIPRADYIGTDGLSERTDLGGLNLSDVPKVLLETGNMRNETDAALLKDPAFRSRIAEAITAALTQYLMSR